MKHLVLLYFLLFLPGIRTHAQKQINVIENDDDGFKVLDKSKYKCTYSHSYLSDSTNTESRKEDSFVLLIGGQHNLLKNEFKYYIDSLRYLNSKGLVSDEQVGKGFTSYTPGNSLINYFIIEQHNNPELVITYTTTEGIWETKDTVKLKWTLGNKSERICGFNCKDASTFFRGRKYIAWYALDVPLPYGPYKFSGLPGLIIKISDIQNSHIFELKGLQNHSFAIFLENQKTIKMSKEQCDKAIRNYKTGLVEKAKMWFPNDPEKAKGLAKRFSNENNMIELE